MIVVQFAGLYSSIQDLGRLGMRNMGVPTSGVMDHYSARLANAMLNNDENCALIEMTYQGMVVFFEESAVIAITGAFSVMTIDGKLCQHNSVIAITAGSVLKIGHFSEGARAYLGISGGFNCPKILNSCSYYRGITDQVRIKKGDRLFFHRPHKAVLNRASIKVEHQHFHSVDLEVLPGPELSFLSEKVRYLLLNQEFTVANTSNRMAYQLISNRKTADGFSAPEIISSAVQAGTIQLTPGSDLMVLMRDCQTTGGYARVLQLSQRSIDQLAQKRPGQKISFKLISD